MRNSLKALGFSSFAYLFVGFGVEKCASCRTDIFGRRLSCKARYVGGCGCFAHTLSPKRGKRVSEIRLRDALLRTAQYGLWLRLFGALPQIRLRMAAQIAPTRIAFARTRKRPAAVFALRMRPCGLVLNAMRFFVPFFSKCIFPMPKDSVSREFKEANGFVPEKIAATVAAFYEQIDDLTAQVEANFQAQGACARCRPGCSSCCIDNLTVTQAEAAVIVAQYPDVLNESPHAPGMCAFLDEQGLCRIYRARPVKCRTFGVAQRWQQQDDASGETCEMRAICPLRQNDADLSRCDASCFIAPLIMDMKLGMMEKLTYGHEKRIHLRSLFHN